MHFSYELGWSLTIQCYKVPFPDTNQFSIMQYILFTYQLQEQGQVDGCIVWNAHNTVLGEEALLIYIVPVCYVKTGRCGKS